MKLNDYILTSNTGLDAIQRAPIVNEKTGIKCLRIQDISQNKSYNDWGNTKVSKENYDAFKLLKNDLIIARTGSTVGINMIIKNDLKSVYNNGLIRLRTNHNAIPYYIYLVMQTNKFKSYINNIACGSSTQPNLRIADLLNYDFKVHNINKQQHIVDTIGSIDDLIEKYEENISKLLYISDLEIKKIYDNKSYHLSKLLDCLSILKDGTHNPPKRVKIGIPLLTGQNIDNGFINHKDITYVSLEDYNKIHSKYAPSIGDLVITKIGTVGKVAVLRKQDIPITIHCNSALLRFKTIHYSTAFFVLNSKDFQNEFHTHKNQTVQEFINLEQLGNLDVKIPECDESIFDNIFCSISKYKDIIDKLNQLKQLYLKKFFG